MKFEDFKEKFGKPEPIKQEKPKVRLGKPHQDYLNGFNMDKTYKEGFKQYSRLSDEEKKKVDEQSKKWLEFLEKELMLPIILLKVEPDLKGVWYFADLKERFQKEFPDVDDYNFLTLLKVYKYRLLKSLNNFQ